MLKLLSQHLSFVDAAPPSIEKQFSFWILLFWCLIIFTDMLHLTSFSNILFLDEVIICPFRLITGVMCPGCGMTRSFLSIGHGAMVDVISYNPIGPFLFSYFVYQISPIRFKTTLLSKKRSKILKTLIVVVILFWWGLTRL